MFTFFQYSFDFSYIFATKKLPPTAREVFYNNFSSYFIIKNSKIIKKPQEEEDLADISNIFITSNKHAEECHED